MVYRLRVLVHFSPTLIVLLDRYLERTSPTMLRGTWEDGGTFLLEFLPKNLLEQIT